MKKLLLSILGLGILFFSGYQIFAASSIYIYSLGNGFTFSQDTDFSYISYGSKVLYSEKNEDINVACIEKEDLLTENTARTMTEKALMNNFFQFVRVDKMSIYAAGEKIKQADQKKYGTLIHRACWQKLLKVQSLGKNWYSILYPPYEGSQYALYNTRYGKYYDFNTISNSIVQVKVGVTGVYVSYGDGERGEQWILLLTNDGKVIKQVLTMNNNEVLLSFDLLTGKRIQLNLLTNTQYDDNGQVHGTPGKRIINVQF